MQTNILKIEKKRIAAALLLAVLLLAGCRSGDKAPDAAVSDAGQPLAAAPSAQSGSASRPADEPVGLQLVVLPDAGDGPLMQAIDSAQQSIRLKVYLITLDEVVDALKAAAQRGVDVRVMIEPEPQGGGESQPLRPSRSCAARALTCATRPAPSVSATKRAWWWTTGGRTS